MILGHENQKKIIQDTLDNSRHHALILAGPKGIGKSSLAFEISVQTLQKYTPTSAHIVENQCHLGSYQNYTYISPLVDDNNKQKNEISVDQIRTAISSFKHKSSIHGPRIVVIDAASELNISAANALLKILEEPPFNLFFILIAHQVSGILPTIRSRCLQVNFNPLNTDNFKKVISALKLEPHESLINYSMGCPGFYLNIYNAGGEKLVNSLKNLLDTKNLNDLKTNIQEILKTPNTTDTLCLNLLHQILYKKTLIHPNLAHATQALDRFVRKTQNSHLDQTQRIIGAVLIAQNPENTEQIYQ